MNKLTIADAKDRARKEREIISDKAYEQMASGVLVRDPERLDIRGTLTCGENVEIDINVIIEGNVILKDEVTIGANCILRNCSIGKGTNINSFSLIEDAVVGEQSFIGPYGRLRPGTLISDNVQIGNFVEIKNSRIDSKCRINHLSFIGDSELSSRVTVGAGSITCNHDTINVNRTVIEEGAYIGSGCNLVAPITIGKNSVVGSGSTVTENVSVDKLVLARARQVTIDDWKGPRSRKDD